jgi:hypothetical protein
LIRTLCLVALALSLSGCDVVRSAFMEPADKVNAAFPLLDRLQQSQEQLFANPDEAGAAPLRAAYAQRLQARATTCSRQSPPGRFDTVNGIRHKLGNSACFHEQDLALLDWVGLQRFLLAMRKPALVRFAPLPAHLAIPPQPESTVDIAAARNANVAVLRGALGRLATIDLQSGQALRSFAAPESVRGALALSPNGRVLAVPGADALTLFDAESGETLWTTQKFKAVAAWLPEVEATLFTPREPAAPSLLDQRSGALLPYPLQLPEPTWTIAAGGAKARQVMGNDKALSVVDHGRNPDGSLNATLVSQREIPGAGITVLPPLLMDSGKRLVYGAGSDLAWLDIGSGEEGSWNTSALEGRGFSKNSETSVYLDINQPGPLGGARLLDIDKATLARVAGDSGEGTLAPLGTREGWARRDQVVSFGQGAAPQGQPEPIGKVIVDTQMARLAPR